ncbi:hypothetical protein MKX01_013489 [Papaver californicum]|nr:hypothetical protein MKX01_013489 [Papaver californicum]
MNTDPCTDWTGVLCNYNSTAVKKIILDSMSLPGTLDAVSLYATGALTVLSLNNNTITGEMPHEMGNCTQLAHIYLSGNRISGSLPSSLSNLENLKKLDISDNYFSGALPDFTRISGLVSFIFDFMHLQIFNVSFNYFTGPIPELKGRFLIDSFLGNPGLCGYPSDLPLNIGCTGCTKMGATNH